MKAIRYTTYGSPDVLQLQEVEKPTPKANEVLIKVHAASANPLDWHFMRAAPFLVRLEAGFFKPSNPKLGADVAGRVEAIGAEVTDFKVGDEVFGDVVKSGLGAFAEYACGPQETLALKPANISFEEAAAVPVAAVTALQGLNHGKIQAGQRVLVNGASGGVGTYAVQIAKSFGAEVTGVCSTRNLELVQSIGADHVIDYTKEDFTKNGQRYDLVFDMVANYSAGQAKRALAPKGHYVLGGFSTILHMLGFVMMGKWASKADGQQIGMMGTANPNKKDLLILKGLLESGKLKSVIDRRYPLSQTADAIRYLETSRARGKVIIVMD